jgi:hypothetical protein
LIGCVKNISHMSEKYFSFLRFTNQDYSQNQDEKLNLATP